MKEIYESVLKDDGPMRVFMVHNKDFPKRSARHLSVRILNPRNGRHFDVELPEYPAKGTIGHRERLKSKEPTNDQTK
jgi:hypothetical protein